MACEVLKRKKERQKMIKQTYSQNCFKRKPSIPLKFTRRRSEQG